MFGFGSSGRTLPPPALLPDPREHDQRDVHLVADSETNRVFFRTDCKLSAILRAESVAGALLWAQHRYVVLTSIWYDDMTGELKTDTMYFYPEPILPDVYYGCDDPEL